jgi:hypothetical protein
MEIGIGAFIAVLIGGASMGYYLARLHNFYPPKGTWFSRVISKTVFGWSFLIPLAIETKLFENGNMGFGQWVAICFLWMVFSTTTVASNCAFSGKHREQK